jgi:hypothetical protein
LRLEHHVLFSAAFAPRLTKLNVATKPSKDMNLSPDLQCATLYLTADESRVKTGPLLKKIRQIHATKVSVENLSNTSEHMFWTLARFRKYRVSTMK